MISKNISIAHRLSFYSVLIMAVSMPLSRAVFNFASITLLIGWIWSGSFKEKWTTIRNIPFLWTHFFFVITAIMATQYSLANVSTAWGQVIVYSKLLLVPMILTTVTNANQAYRVLHALILGLGVVLLTLIADIWFEIPGTKTYNNPTSLNKGVFTHHIVQGMHLALLTIFSLYAAQQYANKAKMVCWILIASMAAGAGLLINGSRAGHLALLMGLASLVFFSMRGLHRLLGMILLCLVIFGAYQGSDFFKTRIDTAFSDLTEYKQDNEKTSGGARLAAWEISRNLWKENPLLGVGLGAYKQEATPRFKDQSLCELGVCEQPHNQWLLVSAEQGLIGLAALLALCFSIFFFREGRNPYVIATWACVWAVSLFDSLLLIRHQTFTYVMAMTVIILVVQYKKESTR